MNKEDFLRLVESEMVIAMNILIERGEHYASNEDFLENFKHTAILMNEVGFSLHGKPLTPQDVCLMFELIKVQRWSNRVREGRDPVDDNRDGINYHLLGLGCRADEKIAKSERERER